MLKAVRFDEDKHKHLLDFILTYKDNKGKTNESEAIRFLMQTGFDAICNNSIPATNNPDISSIKEEITKQVVQEMSSVYQNKQQDQQQSINIDSLKKELLNDLMLQINNQALNNLNNIVEKLSTIQPMVITQPVVQNTQEDQQFTKINTPSTPDPIPKKKIEVPADASGLLGNLLANANR